MLRIWIIGLLIAAFSAFNTQPTAAQQNDACANRSAQPTGMNEHTIESNGITRRFLIYVPESYDPTQPTPVVFSIHGFASNPSQQAEFSRWHELAEAENILAVYPQGTGAPARWNAGGLFSRDFEGPQLLGAPPEEDADDVGFFNDLLDYLEANYCVDTSRVYATGLSNGGGMSYLLACEMSERISAIGAVAAAFAFPLEECAPSEPVPAVVVHGVQDPIVPYEGVSEIGLPAVPVWTADWAALNNCDDTPLVTEIAPTVIKTEYTDCAAPVTLYTISDGGHTWPGGFVLPEFLVGKTSDAIDATDVIWAFFESLAG